MEKRIYYKFSDYLVKKYGEKVYKLPLNVKTTCPNRDGTKSHQGCIFCGEEGAGFEALSSELSIEEQIMENSGYIGSQYSAKKFIAYFQNYTNTYLPLSELECLIKKACMSNICAIYISTRPDCVTEEIAELLQEISKENKIDIVLEIGLQTINYKTLEILNRQHGLAEFIDSVLISHKFGLDVCAHYISDLPWDSIEDTAEGARVLSALKVEQVKLHSLYVLENTRLGEMYKRGDFSPISKEEFIERTICFLENLSPNIVVQRLLGRAPADRTLFCSWNTSWRKICDEIEEKMEIEGSYQGKLFNYLNGSGLNEKKK